MDWLKVGGLAIQSTASLLEGLEKQAGAKADAEQLKRAANQQLAAGTRQVANIKRDGKRVQSDAVAINAANGGTFDAGMIERLARLQSNTSYNVMATMFQAESEAAQMRYRARLTKRAGRNAMIGGVLKSVPSFLDIADEFAE